MKFANYFRPVSRATCAVFLSYSLMGCAAEIHEEPKGPLNFFPSSEVCSYPADGPVVTFRNLGGGTWETSGRTDRTSSFECIGANQTVTLYDNAAGKIEIGYHARGTDKGGTTVTLKYRAEGGRPIPNESTYRNMFANLVDNTSKLALKNSLPDLYRKRMSNLESYGRIGKGSAENYDVGTGFISVTREISEDRLTLSVDAKLYSDAAMKLKN
ncbi:MAG TPA: hypothetical protein PKD26_15250 [Pyrinomonadaceae bacterium]|nr:hypothetical protein [Pyrinomonadaceae bacterium]